MSMHIQKFVDRLRASESRGQKDFVMSLTDAKDLHSDITKLLLDLQSMQTKNQPAASEQVVTVEIAGGTFK